MHGCGNDYVFVDTIGGPGLPEDTDVNRLAVQLSDRHFGVGGDGLILIERRPSGRLGMRMFNADGSEGEMCGNGMRCLAAYCFGEGYVMDTRFEVETLAGVIAPVVTPEPGERRVASVTVDMGPPREVTPGVVVALPRKAGGPPGPSESPPSFRGTFVSMGNPHFVITLPDVEDIDIAGVGPLLERHPAFPSGANIEFVNVLSPEGLRMRVWERGSGVTLACGTGASAAVVATATGGLTGRRVTVVADGGDLEVEWAREGPVLVTGPAEEVFRTKYSKAIPRRR